MKVDSKVISIDVNECGKAKIELKDIDIEKIRLNTPCVMSIDGSTDNTGISILSEKDGSIIAVIAIKREKDTENPVKYKVKLKSVLCDLLKANSCISKVFYEEPFIGYATAIKNLFMLRTTIEEIKYEQEPDLDYLVIKEINNLKWKSDFLKPARCPQGTKAQKEKVREKLVENMDFLKSITQDEIDAIAMGYTAIKMGYAEQTKEGKIYRFNYESRFVGADADEAAIQTILEIKDIPEVVKENGIMFVRLSGIGDFSKKVYSEMGSEDKLLIMKFSSNKYGNIILKNRLGALATEFDYIYVAVWRSNRKKKSK